LKVSQQFIMPDMTEHLKDLSPETAALIPQRKGGAMEIEAEVWIETGDIPWIRQIRPDMTKALERFGHLPHPGENLAPANAADAPPGASASAPSNPLAGLSTIMRDMKMDFTVRFTSWEVNPTFPEGTFTFTPPAGARLFDPRKDNPADLFNDSSRGDLNP
jgi:hypothetical protein